MEKVKIIEELELRFNSFQTTEQKSFEIKNCHELELLKMEKEKCFCKLTEKERIL